MTHWNMSTSRIGSVRDVGPVPVLDIGGRFGAVLVRGSGPAPSDELWVCPRGEPGRSFHTGVHLRGYGWFAVFPEVAAGDYSLLKGDVETGWFAVAGGQVTMIET